MSILEYAKLAEPCQRNWLEDKAMPQEDIDYIIETCTSMPTKQQVPYYSVAYITDRKLIDQVFEVTYDAHDKARTYLKNSQVRANLLMIWLDNPDFSHEIGSWNNGQRMVHEQDTIFSVGIAAGAAALAGVEKGYRTGFCKCFDETKVKKLLQPSIGKIFKTTHIRLMLGIGTPDTDLDKRDVSINGNVIRRQPSFGKKEIKLFKIQ